MLTLRFVRDSAREALEDWATPIAALGVRPGHFTSAEYYAVPADNLRTYPVYVPEHEPAGYWEWSRSAPAAKLIEDFWGRPFSAEAWGRRVSATNRRQH